MEISAAQCLLVIGITLIFSGVAYAVGRWQDGSRFTSKKRSSDAPPIPISDAHYLALRAEMAELSLTLEKLTTTVKRISSREGMRALRAERATGDAPPVGASKAELRAFYLKDSN